MAAAVPPHGWPAVAAHVVMRCAFLHTDVPPSAQARPRPHLSAARGAVAPGAPLLRFSRLQVLAEL